MQGIFRQGDVLIRRIDTMPVGITPRPLDRGRVILAYGEVTGHCHQIDTPSAVSLYNPPSSEVDAESAIDLSYITVDRLSQLVHEEHSAITLEPGNYRVIRQREYAPDQLRSVAD